MRGTGTRGAFFRKGLRARQEALRGSRRPLGHRRARSASERVPEGLDGRSEPYRPSHPGQENPLRLLTNPSERVIVRVVPVCAQVTVLRRPMSIAAAGRCFQPLPTAVPASCVAPPVRPGGQNAPAPWPASYRHDPSRAERNGQRGTGRVVFVGRRREREGRSRRPGRTRALPGGIVQRLTP